MIDLVVCGCFLFGHGFQKILRLKFEVTDRRIIRLIAFVTQIVHHGLCFFKRVEVKVERCAVSASGALQQLVLMINDKLLIVRNPLVIRLCSLEV